MTSQPPPKVHKLGTKDSTARRVLRNSGAPGAFGRGRADGHPKGASNTAGGKRGCSEAVVQPPPEVKVRIAAVAHECALGDVQVEPRGHGEKQNLEQAGGGGRDLTLRNAAAKSPAHTVSDPRGSGWAADNAQTTGSKRIAQGETEAGQP